MGSSLQVDFSSVWYDIFSRPRCSDGMGTIFFPNLMHSIYPKDPNSAPCNPYWHTWIFFFNLMHSICPRDLNSARCNRCWYTRIFFSSLMHSICPRDLNLAPHTSQQPAFRTLTFAQCKAYSHSLWNEWFVHYAHGRPRVPLHSLPNAQWAVTFEKANGAGCVLMPS